MRAESLQQLREWMPRGSRVFLVLRHRSRNGMSREIGVVVFRDGHALHPNGNVAETLGLRVGKRDGVLVRGCGMDMGFDLVRRLSSALYDESQALTHEWL